MSWVLYSRHNCSLCDSFEYELSEQLPAVAQIMEIQDVDADTELRTIYGNDVPVLTFNNEIICQHFFDQDKILKALS